MRFYLRKTIARRGVEIVSYRFYTQFEKTNFLAPKFPKQKVALLASECGKSQKALCEDLQNYEPQKLRLQHRLYCQRQAETPHRQQSY